MKRISLLLVVVLMALGSADAFACKQCRVDTGGNDICVTRPEGGFSCDFSAGCTEVGVCPALAAAETSLASQWTITSVERLDGNRTITSTAVQAAQLAPKSAPKP